MRKIIGIATLTVGLFACGGTPVASCETTSPHLCFDVETANVEQANAVCKGTGGTVGSGCSHLNATGGCKTKVMELPSGGEVNQIKWSYADSGTDMMITPASCMGDSGSYVAP